MSFKPAKPHRRLRLPRPAALARAALPIVVAASIAGCRESAGAFGTAPATIRRNADQLFGGIASRFGTIERSPKAATARRRLIRAALVPSKAWDDTSVWSIRPTEASRTLLIGGRAVGQSYYFWEDPALARPAHPGDSFHAMHLARLGDGLFRWNTGVDFGVGDVGAEAVASVFGRVVGAAEGRDEARVRADYRSAFARTTIVLGQLATLDTLRLVPLADGTTQQYLVVRLDPNRLRARYPHFAAYLRKYVSTGRARLTLKDRGGATWLIADARDERLRFQLRSRGGRLAPLAGPARTLPDTLVLEADMTMKVKLWTVGFSRLVTEVVVDDGPDRRTWTVHARREPEWHLPLITERLLRTPLRRPFAGRGAMFRVGVREERGTTLLTRSAELTVEESAILRFLNSLGGTVLDDFDPRTEREQNQFVREVFLAMRADVRALTE